MDNINILYIDDNPDTSLSLCLAKEYRPSLYSIRHSDIKFNPLDGYESLIKDPKVQLANVIIIDSSLFENRTTLTDLFTGEEFKIILNKYYPFIEVIVITQNGENPELNIISKYQPKLGGTALEYYKDVLPKILDDAINNVQINRKLAKRLSENNGFEDVLKQKILRSINGESIYDELTKTDIDDLIKAFKDIQEKIDER